MSEATAVLNPFADAPVVAQPAAGELAAATGSAREVAEVQSMMVMARRFPRDEMAIMDRILQACTRPSLAEGALYEYARGGTDIRGPSIRLAECIAQYWGHLDFGWRVLEERPGATKVQAFAWDMQTGTRSQMVFDVLHQRDTRGGSKMLADSRDIYEHVANAASRRLRACILRVVPGDVVEAAVKQCEKTITIKAEVTPERLQSLLTQFADFGVTKGAIERRLQRRLESITPGMMVQLGKIFTSLRDAMSQPGDWFDLEGPQEAPAKPSGGPQEAAPPAKGSAAVRQRLQARKPQPAPQTQAPAEEPTPPAFPTSQAFRDVVRFAAAAQTKEDIARTAVMAAHITDEAEAMLAQEHLDKARARIEGRLTT